jgi:predicted enzyme related to lactoylglutathione lyase
MTQATIGLVLDATDPESLADFWTKALDLQRVGAAGNYVQLESEGLPKLLLQRVSDQKVAKNRMHIDIQVHEVEAEVARLEALGAKRLEDQDRCEHGCRWVVMADPEGNEFCVCDSGINAGDG